MYSKVGRLFIKAQKKQVVWVAGVMREEGITVDKVMDLIIEKVRVGVTKKIARRTRPGRRRASFSKLVTNVIFVN